MILVCALNLSNSSVTTCILYVHFVIASRYIRLSLLVFDFCKKCHIHCNDYDNFSHLRLAILNIFEHSYRATVDK